jgi:hypothetical protein
MPHSHRPVELHLLAEQLGGYSTAQQKGRATRLGALLVAHQ